MSVLLLASASAEELQDIVVKPGDTLWSIAGRYLKDPSKWNELLKYNRLPTRDADLILPGMALKVPVLLVKEEYRAAKLASAAGLVLFRKRGSVDWRRAAADMALYRGDRLRTGPTGRAEISFTLEADTDTGLTVLPGSLVVISPQPRSAPEADIELHSGEIRGTHATVMTNSALVIPRTEDTRFDASVDKDLNTRVRVRKGSAAVRAGGREVVVREDFAVEIRPGMPPSDPVRLEAAVDAGSALPAIPPGSPVRRYHVQISRDPDFSSLIMDRSFDVLDAVELDKLLPPGEFWMRVSYVDLLDFEGKFGKPRRITVAKHQVLRDADD
ncbi:MAG: hypothetical protein A3J79_10015 [Elusimicrobia bacterium RIFOXYB2_FULL_62_6]|nr:MAG: hypothetical protein A3J79_10015 [Elusimicrobia bacterium RIFOXYB2_FULL_62_6]